MTSFSLRETDDGLRLEPNRSFGVESFTWAHLLYGRLEEVKIYVLYFPSRFDRPEDETVTALLRTFGDRTAADTSVNFWDTGDPRLPDALELFRVKAPPALVLVSGLELESVEDRGPDASDVYAVTVTDTRTLRDADRVVEAVNTAHTILARCDAAEIAAYVRGQKRQSLLDAIGRLGGQIRDQILAFKPTFGLPGGFTIGVG